MIEYFYLHIKKCAGTSVKSFLADKYHRVEKKKLKPFIALPKEQWNDAINNYRLSLGEYDFKRMLFVKKYLFSEKEFDKMFKFTIVRNPYDRAFSAWKYLKGILPFTRKGIMAKLSFEEFLKMLPLLWQEKTFRERQVFTHTAPIWPDITDEYNNNLMDYIGKVESIGEDLEYISKVLNIHYDDIPKLKDNNNRPNYRKFYTKRTKDIVEKLYSEDIKNLSYEF